MTVTPLEYEWREWRLGEGRYKGLGPASKPRPSRFPLPIPLLWWTRLAVFLARRKAASPPAPPPFNPLAFWRSTGVFEGWGLGNGQFTPSRLCEIAFNRGCEWIAVQDSAEDRPKRDAIRNACNAYGIKLVIWQTAPITAFGALDAIAYWQPHAYIAEVEKRVDGGWDTFARTVAEKHPTLPKAIITNFWGSGGVPGGYDRAESELWWRNGWACITESYMVNEHGPQPSLAPDMLDWTAKTHLGFPETFPCFGIYRCPPSFYDSYLAAWPSHSWYMAEHLPEAS